MHPPFLIYALPRSRTAWLSAFLSYRDWTCYHEQAIYLRSLADIENLLRRPNTGSAETVAAQAWPLIKHILPEHKAIVIQRPVDDIMASVLSLGALYGIFYDTDHLYKVLKYGARCLDRISNVNRTMTIRYDRLDDRETVRTLFEFCLPYRFDESWWLQLKDRNIQADIEGIFNYYKRNKQELDGFKSTLKRDLIRLTRAGELRHAFRAYG